MKRFNKFLFSLVCLLVGFSILFFFTLSAPESLQRFGNTYYFFLRQFLLGFLPAIICGVIAYKIPLKFFKKWSFLLIILNMGAMFLVFLPGIGVKAGGASRWLNFGFFSIQPSEFLKITSILYLSAWIASKLSDERAQDWKERVKKNYHNFVYILIPFLVLLGIITMALFLQSDASTLGIIALTLLAIYFSSRTPFWHTLCIILLGVSFLALIVKFEPYRFDRWFIFLNPEYDPLGMGFQLNQSIISLGSGGLWGRGLGMSIQKFGYLPQAMTDSIFAIIGEELGFIGCAMLIAVFLLFFWEGIKIYKNTNDKFAKLTAIGITFWISLQTFINMASAAGIFPLTGIPLPFFSYGGSHLVVELIGVGILLNISKNA